MAITSLIPGSLTAAATTPLPPDPVAPTTIATDQGLEEIALSSSNHTLDFDTFVHKTVAATITGTCRLVLPAAAGVAATCRLRAVITGPATFTVHHSSIAGTTLLTVTQPSGTERVVADFARLVGEWELIEAGYDS
jgi:hypothetical protein